MNSALKDRIVAAAKAPSRMRPAVLCGETVYLRSLTLAELDAYTKAIKPLDDETDRYRINAALVAAMVRDEEGNTLFTADEVMQCIPSPDCLALASEAVKTMNGSHDDAKKNSNATPTDASASGSPAISAVP